MTSNSEIDRQESIPWHRTGFYSEYNTILGKYKIESCLKYMHKSSVLDLACGDGFLTSLYCQKFKRVVGVDASKKHLDEARKRLPHVQFIHSLIEDITFEEQFDNVLLLDILQDAFNPPDGLVFKKWIVGRRGIRVGPGWCRKKGLESRVLSCML